MSEGFNPQINNNAEVGEQNIAQSIDKSQGKTHNEVHGDVENLTSNQTNNIENAYMEAVKNAFEEMQKVADEMGVPAFVEPIEHGQDPYVATDEPAELPRELGVEDFEAFEPVEVNDGSDAPMAVYSMVQKMEASPEPPTEEEQAGLFSRMASSVTKFATSDKAIACWKMVLAGLEATASISPPGNIIAAVIKTGVALKDK